MEEAKSKETVVLMVPLPSQSHLNQLLQLSGVIASHGIPVHFVGTATHNRQARLRSHGLKPNAQIKFHDLSTAPIPAPAPDPHAADKTPMHLAPATIAYAALREQVGLLARELSLGPATRLVVVYDRMGPEAVRDAVSLPNAESYSFNCLSAFNLFLILWEVMGKPFQLHDAMIEKLPSGSVREFMSEGALYFSASENIPEREGDIHNTIRLLDEAYIGLMSREEISGGKKQWAIRPSCGFDLERESSHDHECLKWLDQQAPRSVIYVSFGTTTSLRDEEYVEIAMGLEKSGVKFIWLVREADRADIFAGEGRRIELPVGFEERVRERGVVVREWAPQTEILRHPSTGGFMSHCGWNSCLESLTVGVPMAAWPMHSDQPMNAIFVAEVLGAGLEVREWARRFELVEAAAVKDAVVRLMASEEGEGMRRRAAEVGAAVRSSMEEGGETCMEIKSFIAHITR